MRIHAFLLAALFLAGCSSPAADVPTDAAVDVDAAPSPVVIHEVLDLSTGAQDAWSFDIAPNATLVEVRFFGTGPEGTPLGGGLPACLTFSTPRGDDAAGICQGGTGGNLQVSPYVVAVERVFYGAGADAAPGHYAFSLVAQPSATEFHAVVNVQY